MIINNIKSFCLILTILIPATVWSKSNLPVLSTKQAASNLRFFTDDGKATYYQRRSGSLLLSSNYKVAEIMKGEPGTMYTMKASNNRKNILIEKNENFHSYYSMRSLRKIYSVPYGGSNAKKVGNGVDAQLQLDDQWVSFFQYQSRKIFIESLISENLGYSITLNNKTNPYFKPEVIMLNPKKVIFTDLNSNGFPGVMLLEKETNKITNLFKVENINVKFEICSLDSQKFAFAIFPLNPAEDNPPSEISIIDRASPDFSKRNIIYTSKKSDIGNIICSIDGKEIYFTQDQSNENKIITNSVEINILTQEVKTLSDVNDAHRMSYVDGMLLLPNKGKLLILKGKKNLKELDSIGN